MVMLPTTLPQQSIDTREIDQLSNLSADIKDDLELIFVFLKNKEEDSLETVRVYATEIKAFLDYIGHPREKLVNVTAKMCLGYREMLNSFTYNKGGKEIHYVAATISRKLYIVSSLFNFAVQIGYLKLNPMSAIRKPKVHITSQQRFLTPSEVEALLSTLKTEKRKNLDVKLRNYIITATFLTSGLRVAELASIRWNMFFEDINGNIGVRIIGKGDEVREVKIRRDVWSYIQQYRSMQGRSIHLDPKDDSPLFLNKESGALSDRYCREMIKRAAKRAGITKDISCHWLRHTSASLAVDGGADIKQLLEQYGWKNIKTGQRYIHDTKKLNDTAADRIKLSL